MASSVHRYLDFLEQRVPIAPANSQEELQAAQSIAGVMRNHDLDVQIEEFEASAAAPIMRAVLQVLLLVGVLAAGIGVLALTIVFGLVAIAAAVLLVLDFMGNDLLVRYSPPARSQNVVACHKASGPLVSKGNRPIVVVAHYDTPRENLLFRPGLSRFRGTLLVVAAVCVPVVALCALVQLFGAGSAFGRVLWVVGILASLPPALVGASTIAEHFMPCTIGSNDNKSSVAALLSVLNVVRPADDDLGADYVPSPERPAVEEAEAEVSPQVEAQPEDEVEYVDQVVGYRYEEVVGVRHGKEVIEGLGMLPEGCELEYLEPQPVEEIVEKVPVRRPRRAPQAVASEDAETLTDLTPLDDAPAAADETVAMEAVEADGPAPEEAPAPADDATRPIADERASDEHASEAGGSDDATDADGEPPMPGDGDDSGLEVADDRPGPDATVPTEPAAPATPDDPEWGTSTFRPKARSVSFGRRASLFDLPDPSRAESDPLGSVGSDDAAPQKPLSTVPAAGGETVAMPPVTAADPDATVMAPPVEPADPEPADPMPEVRQLNADPMTDAAPAGKGRRKAHRLFGRKRTQEQESMSEWLGVEDDFDAKRDGQAIGSWENFERDEQDRRSRRGGKWKGGAAPSAKFRVIDGGEPSEEAPTEDDLREAILGMGDDELIAHDIWFVALGASSLDRAGMRAFLAQHRTSCRGAFLINLDSVGAGRLSLVAEEGIRNKRRADRRLTRLLTSTAQDLHVELDKIPSCPAGTDATVAMQSSLRSITIMGTDDGLNPALSHTSADVPEEVDERQVSAVADLVCEVIRRS